jgi:phospholipid-binding lipoprotein MlaA
MRFLVAAALMALASGCASVPGAAPQKDPWESLNRGTYEFNDSLDRLAFKPVARFYADVVPGFAQEGVYNFFENVYDVNTGLNNLLQGKFAEGASDLARFAVNTVMGIGGLWDLATPMGLEKRQEDFGQTLGWWGVPPGPYLVLPFLGPSTVRDAAGRVVDPNYAYSRQISDIVVRNSIFALDTIRTRAGYLKAGKIVDEAAAIDPYSFTRDAWLQRRRNQVFDGRPPRDPEDE